MRQGPFVLRATALLSVGVLVVHELRYRLAFGGHADHALEAHGHGYLSLVAPVVGLLVLVAAARLLQQVAAGASEGAPGSLTRQWILTAVSLVVAFTAQELLEGALAPGHPAGFDGAFGDGGWIALPLALAVGGAIAWCLRGADRLVASGVDVGPGLVRPVAAATERAHLPATSSAKVRSPLATRAAGRAPPLVCV
ncbi:MAG TPA: hypothetical protein VGW10_02640 [Solirubrobacteraceae bacterium]|nr:hypothetical protein [Solirubrobacteraceae bacterium]